MRFLQRAAVAALAVALTAAPPTAGSAHGFGAMNLTPFANYSASWPVTITGSAFSNDTGCLTLSGTAAGGRASLVFDARSYPEGSFLVISGTLIATITEPLYGQNGALMFTAPASQNHLSTGVFENVEGGSDFDAGVLTIGARNHCSTSSTR
jgi:hypothetical protein